jgi:hypothetical protein
MEYNMPSLSPELESTIHDALVQVHSSLDGRLGWEFRRSIWLLFGPRIVDEQEWAVHGIGFRRRWNLAAQTSRHLLPLWEVFRSEDHAPHRLLTMSEHYLEGDVTTSQLLSAKRKAWHDGINLRILFNDIRSDVLQLASKAAGVALWRCSKIKFPSLDD